MGYRMEEHPRYVTRIVPGTQHVTLEDWYRDAESWEQLAGRVFWLALSAGIAIGAVAVALLW